MSLHAAAWTESGAAVLLQTCSQNRSWWSILPHISMSIYVLDMCYCICINYVYICIYIQMWMMWHMADWSHSNPFLTEACCDRLFSVLTPLRHRVRRHVLPQKWTAWWLGISAGYIMVIVDIVGIIQSWNIQMPDGVWYFTFEIDARKLPRSLLKKIAESSVSDEWACLAVLHFFLVLTWETCLLVWWRLKAFRSELLFANHVSQYWKIYCQHLRQDCQAATFMNMETLTSEPPSCFVGIHGFHRFPLFGHLGPWAHFLAFRQRAGCRLWRKQLSTSSQCRPK